MARKASGVFEGVDTPMHTMENERTTDCIGIINLSCLFRAHLFCINRALLVFLFLWNGKHDGYLQFESYEIAFSWCLWQTSFPIHFLFFTKICLTSPSNKYPPCWSFKPADSNQFKVDIKSRTGLMWNADMWLIFQRQHVQH